MSDVVIVSGDAERLVREGGVHNSDERPVVRERERYVHHDYNGSPDERVREVLVEVQPPFTVELIGPCPGCESMWGVHTEPTEAKLDHGVSAGTVTVVDVHHADDDYVTNPVEYVAATRAPAVEFKPCHPGAEDGKWHWLTEGGDNDNVR